MMIIAICGFTFAGLCGMARLLIGPTLADRVMALDVCLISLMGAIAVDAARRDDGTFLIALVVLAIIGFTAAVAASRFLELEHHSDVAGAGPLGVSSPSPDLSDTDLRSPEEQR